jgi:hypothetical protein
LRDLHIVIADGHWPETNLPALKAILKYIKANHKRIASCTLLGDMLDLSCISHWTSGKPGLREKGALQKDLNGFFDNVLSPLEKALPHKAQRIFHIGNHERNLVQDLIEEHPELAGAIDLNNMLEVRGWKVVELGQTSTIGKLTLVHGENIGGQNPAKKALEIYCTNVLLAHHHSPSSYSKTGPKLKQKWMATVMPCLCGLAPRWLKGRLNAWVVGFCTVSLHPNGKNFNLTTYIMPDGKSFMADGKEYGRK